MKMKTCACLAGAALLVATCGAAAASLSGKEITKLLAGASGTWHTTNGKVRGQVAWTSDGRQTVTGNLGAISKDSARWWVKGNRFCNKFGKLRHGKAHCDRVERIGASTYRMGNTIFELN